MMKRKYLLIPARTRIDEVGYALLYQASDVTKSNHPNASKTNPIGPSRVPTSVRRTMEGNKVHRSYMHAACNSVRQRLDRAQR
jgi:hypothetical protein